MGAHNPGNNTKGQLPPQSFLKRLLEIILSEKTNAECDKVFRSLVAAPYLGDNQICAIDSNKTGNNFFLIPLM